MIGAIFRMIIFLVLGGVIGILVSTSGTLDVPAIIKDMEQDKFNAAVIVEFKRIRQEQNILIQNQNSILEYLQREPI